MQATANGRTAIPDEILKILFQKKSASLMKMNSKNLQMIGS